MVRQKPQRPRASQIPARTPGQRIATASMRTPGQRPTAVPVANHVAVLLASAAVPPPAADELDTYRLREPRRIHLLMEWYVDESTARTAEFRACLRENLANEHVERIHAFGLPEHLAQIADSPRLTKIPIVGRTTFEEFFRYAAVNLNGQMCAILNSDVHFDSTLGLAAKADLSGRFVSLTRWDLLTDGSLRFFDRPDSSDAWIFESPMRVPGSGFTLGKPGCDNRIAYLAAEAGFRLSNPSRSVVLHHLHLSGKRNYTQQDTVPGPYEVVWPTYLKFS